MPKSGGSTLGTILKWGVILVVVYLVYRWWVNLSAAASTSALSSSTPAAVAPSWYGYANPGGFISIPGVGNGFDSVQPQPTPIVQFNPPGAPSSSGPVLSIGPSGGSTPVGPGGGYLPLPIFGPKPILSSKYGAL